MNPAAEQPWDGIDIVAHVAEGKPDLPRTLFWRKPRGETVWMGVREGTLKLVAQRNGDKQSAELFDLAEDVSEQHDLSQARPQDLKRLQTMYRQWEQRVRKDRRGRPAS